MTLQQQQPALLDMDRERDEWLAWVDRLVAEVAGWADAQGWATHRDVKTITERPFGTYQAPFLRVRTPNGEVNVDPIARWTLGRGNERVDLQG